MKKLFCLALFLFSTLSFATDINNPCQSPGGYMQSTFGATTGTTATQIVGLGTYTTIYICALNVTGVSGTSPTFSLVEGTGTNCASNQTTVIGAWTTAANTIYTFVEPAILAKGYALCYKDGGTSPVQNYAITYVQQ